MKKHEIENTRSTYKGLCGLAKKLGYGGRWQQLLNDDGTSATNLIEFFEDNPGACEVVVDWVIEHADSFDKIEDDDEEEFDNEEQEMTDEHAIACERGSNTNFNVKDE